MTTPSVADRQAPTATTFKARQREARTALILQAAHDEFIAKGYRDVAMDEIAAQVGISKGTLYLHFASKEALVVRLLEQEIAQFLGLIDQIISQEMTVRARLERILLETYRGIRNGQQFLLALRSIGGNKGDIWDRLEKQLPAAELTGRFTRLFAEGQQSGELDATIPTAVMVALFFSLMQMYAEQQLAESQPLLPEAFAAVVNRVLFQGLAAPPPAARWTI